MQRSYCGGPVFPLSKLLCLCDGWGHPGATAEKLGASAQSPEWEPIARAFGGWNVQMVRSLISSEDKDSESSIRKGKCRGWSKDLKQGPYVGPQRSEPAGGLASPWAPGLPQEGFGKGGAPGARGGWSPPSRTLEMRGL